MLAGSAAQAAAEAQEQAETPTTMLPLVVSGEKLKSVKTESVSSRKYRAPLRDTPQTITVVPRTLIEEQGARTLTEVLRNVPGIAIQAGEGGGASNTTGDMFTLRGFDASNSLFTDGVRDSGLVSRDTFNTESVEAFLGPNGTDVGRGTASGYINTITKTPKEEAFFSGSATAASGARWRGTLDFNQPLSGDLFSQSGLDQTAARLNLLAETGGVHGRERISNDSIGIAPGLTHGLGTDTRISLFSQHLRQNRMPDYGLPALAGKPVSGVDDEWYYGSTRTNHEDITQDVVTGLLEKDLPGGMHVRALLRHGENERDAAVTAPGFDATTGLITRSFQVNDRTNQILTAQATLGGTRDLLGLRHQWTAAVEAAQERQDSATGSSSTLLPSLAPGTRPDDYLVSPPSTTSFSQGETFTQGVSVFDRMELTRKWSLDGGVRLDRYNTDYQSHTAAAPTPVALQADDTLVASKLGVTFKPVEPGTLYASYGTSMTPPGGTNFTLSGTTTNQNHPNLDPQESETFELGSKWDVFEGGLTLSGALFHTENTNVIYNDDSTGIYHSDGGQVLDGLTLGLTGSPSEAWRIFANATYLDGEVDQPGDQYDGNTLIRTPEWSGSIWTTYSTPWKLTFGIGLRYQGESEGNSANSFQVPSYSVMDAMIQYDFNEHANVRLNLTNLLDRNYIQSINNNGQRYLKGEPFGVSVSTNFDF